MTFDRSKPFLLYVAEKGLAQREGDKVGGSFRTRHEAMAFVFQFRGGTYKVARVVREYVSGRRATVLVGERNVQRGTWLLTTPSADDFRALREVTT